MERPVADQPHDELQQPVEDEHLSDVRQSWEAKTDGTYFLTNMLGGDHSLKFGVGWRKNPIQSFSHYSGGARAHQQCVGNANANCGNGDSVAVGSATGFVPDQAVLYRDQLRNNDWWTYNGYIQDSFSKGRWRLNGGVRYDWQHSKYLGGCVPANVIAPTCCRRSAKTRRRPTPSRQEAAVVQQLVAARVGHLRPDGQRQDVGEGRVVLLLRHEDHAGQQSRRLVHADTLTWGPNQSSGACSTAANSGCWTDANRDWLVQANELIGTPTSSNPSLQKRCAAAGRQHRRSERRDRADARGHRRDAARAHLEPRGRRRLHLPEVRPGHDDLHDGLPAGRPGYPLSQIYTGRRRTRTR